MTAQFNVHNPKAGQVSIPMGAGNLHTVDQDTPEHVLCLAVAAGFAISGLLPMWGFIFSMLAPTDAVFALFGFTVFLLTPLSLGLCSGLFAYKYSASKPLTWATIITACPMLIGLFFLHNTQILAVLPYFLFTFFGAVLGRGWATGRMSLT